MAFRKGKKHPALAWLTKYRGVLNSKGFERYMGLPATSISKYMHTGFFPEVWLPYLQQSINEFRNSDPVLRDYITGRVNAWNHIKYTLDSQAETITSKDPHFILLNAKQEQIIEDLKALYHSLSLENHPLCTFLIKQVRPITATARTWPESIDQ
jgi:hypothetical protein